MRLASALPSGLAVPRLAGPGRSAARLLAALFLTTCVSLVLHGDPARAQDGLSPMAPVTSGPPIPVRVAYASLNNTTSGFAAYGATRFHVENGDGRPHELRFELRCEEDWPRRPIGGSSTTLVVGPSETAAITLPTPQWGETVSIEVRLDGAEFGRVTFGGVGQENMLVAYGTGRYTQTDRAAVSNELRDALTAIIGTEAFRSAEPAAWPAFGWRQQALSSRGSVDLSLTLAPASRLCAAWYELTAAAFVVLDAGDPALDDVTARTFVDFAHAGGCLLLVNARAASAASLRALVAQVPASAPQGLVRTAFGEVLVVQGDVGSLAPTPDAAVFLADAARPWSARLPLTSAPPLPGVGQIPVPLFVGLIVAYVILVGPVAFFYLRRRKQQVLWLLVAPAAGVFVSVTILVGQVLVEGLALKAGRRSVAFLDQRNHTVTEVATHAMYAGLSLSGGLRPRPGTTVIPLPWEGDIAPPMIDLDQGRRVTGAVPARTRTHLLCVQRGPSRERLRFKKSASGLQPLGDAGLDLKDAGLIVRDFGGGYHHWQNGKLDPMNPAAARNALDALFETLDERVSRALFDPNESHTFVGHEWGAALGERSGEATGRERIAPWLARVAGKDPLPPGSYVAVLQTSPVLDELGLTAERQFDAHVLVGLLAQDDITSEP